MATPNPPHDYNAYNIRKGDDSYVRPQTAVSTSVTKRALEELLFISSWDEFGEVCRKQREKRDE